MPSVSIMTEKFVDAAELMAQVLGATNFPFVVIEHPISSATHEALERRAGMATAACVDLLTV